MQLIVIVHQTQIFSPQVFVSQHFSLYPRAQFWIMQGYMKKRARIDLPMLAKPTSTGAKNSLSLSMMKLMTPRKNGGKWWDEQPCSLLIYDLWLNNNWASPSIEPLVLVLYSTALLYALERWIGIIYKFIDKNHICTTFVFKNMTPLTFRHAFDHSFH